MPPVWIPCGLPTPAYALLDRPELENQGHGAPGENHGPPVRPHELTLFEVKARRGRPPISRPGPVATADALDDAPPVPAVELVAVEATLAPPKGPAPAAAADALAPDGDAELEALTATEGAANTRRGKLNIFGLLLDF